MIILSLHKLTLLTTLALLGLFATSPVSAAPILNPEFIHAATSELAPGSVFFPASKPPPSSLRRRNSRLHRRDETGVIQDGGNASVKLEAHAKGIFGLEVEGKAEARAKIGGGNESKKHGGSQEKKKKEKKRTGKKH